MYDLSTFVLRSWKWLPTDNLSFEAQLMGPFNSDDRYFRTWSITPLLVLATFGSGGFYWVSAVLCYSLWVCGVVKLHISTHPDFKMLCYFHPIFSMEQAGRHADKFSNWPWGLWKDCLAPLFFVNRCMMYLIRVTFHSFNSNPSLGLLTHHILSENTFAKTYTYAHYLSCDTLDSSLALL